MKGHRERTERNVTNRSFCHAEKGERERERTGVYRTPFAFAGGVRFDLGEAGYERARSSGDSSRGSHIPAIDIRRADHIGNTLQILVAGAPRRPTMRISPSGSTPASVRPVRSGTPN
jgi:hypothetical protein